MARQGPDGPPRDQGGNGRGAVRRGHRRRGGDGRRRDAQRGGPRVHPRADPALGGARERRRAARHRPEPDPEPAPAVWAADGQRAVQQPDPGPGGLRGGRSDLPAPRRAAVPARRAGRHRRPGRRAAVESGLCRDERLRLRLAAAHDLQPDRRPGHEQPVGRRGRGRGAGGGAGQPRDPERRARRRPVGAVQLVVHPVRAVLRSRPRPDHEGRRDGRRAAQGRRSAHRRPGRRGRHGRRPGEPAAAEPALHGAHPGEEPAGRGPRAHEHDDAVRRPEPDLHVASLAPGLPARVRAARRAALRHRAAARRRRRRGPRQLGRGPGPGPRHPQDRARRLRRARRPAAPDRPVRALHPRPGRLPAARDGNGRQPADVVRHRGRPGDRRDRRPSAPATRSSTTSPTTPSR